MPAFVPNDEALAAGGELVFCCLEHERAAALEPPAGAVVVDLSGAHRLAEPGLYPDWYGFEHPAPGGARRTGATRSRSSSRPRAA